MGIMKHQRIDKWNVELDGKDYWVERTILNGTEAGWSVEVVRKPNNGQNPYSTEVKSDGPVHKKVVAYVKDQIAATQTVDAAGRQMIWAKLPSTVAA